MDTPDERPVAIDVSHVSKSFRLPHEAHGSIKSALINMARHARRDRGYEKQRVLKDVTFDIKEGEFFGIVGRNGSGKSTLLKLLAGIYSQDEGGITIHGRLTPFIELGVGFNPELTGRENVFLNGALLGFSRREMNAMYKSIVRFAELERFMDQKLKNYSSGMQVRLAFSIAIKAQSDILLLDEVLAVGDAIFQKKCYNYFKQLKREGKTVVFVSHDISALEEYCDRGILLEKSELVYQGNIKTVLEKYTAILSDSEEASVNKKRDKSVESLKRVGSGKIRVKKARVRNEQGNVVRYIRDTNDSLQVEVEWEINEDVEDPIYGISIFDAAGQRIFATNNLWQNVPVPAVVKGQKVTTLWTIPNVFNNGTFSVTPASAGSGGSEVFDQVDDMLQFEVDKQQKSNAYTNINHTLHIDAS